jgi:hypothetical protein
MEFGGILICCKGFDKVYRLVDRINPDSSRMGRNWSRKS